MNQADDNGTGSDYDNEAQLDSLRTRAKSAQESTEAQYARWESARDAAAAASLAYFDSPIGGPDCKALHDAHCTAKTIAGAELELLAQRQTHELTLRRELDTLVLP